MKTSNFRLGRALPLACSAFAVAALAIGFTAVLPAQESLPSGRAVIDKHIEAIGGSAAIRAHSSMHVTGTMSIPASGVSGSIEAFAAKPNKTLVRMTIAGVGEVLEGVDGNVAWSLSPMFGPMLAQGKEAEQKKFDADFYAELRSNDRYKSATTVQKTTWEGRPSYKVSLVRHDGSEEFEYYDIENGLRTGREVSRDMSMGTLSVAQITSDYRKFGDLQHPATVKINVMNVQQILTIASVEYDKVDPAVFDLPTAIKALIKP
jgi:hypothetical protein